MVSGPSSFQLAVCWLLSLWAFISRSENEDSSTWVVQTHVQQHDFTASIVFLAFPMLCIPPQESSALSAWGLPATLGTPLGQREGPRTQRQHPSTSCSSRHPHHHHLAPPPTNCRVARCQLPPRPQAGSSQWSGAPRKASQFSSNPTDPAALGVVSMVLGPPPLPQEVAFLCGFPLSQAS